VTVISFWFFNRRNRKCKHQRMYLEILICRWDNPCCALQAHNQQYHHSSFRKDWETTRLFDYLMTTYLWSVCWVVYSVSDSFAMPSMCIVFDWYRQACARFLPALRLPCFRICQTWLVFFLYHHSIVGSGGFNINNGSYGDWQKHFHPLLGRREQLSWQT